jgi:hypothetical protein
MENILVSIGPEAPDPAQLDLFVEGPVTTASEFHGNDAGSVPECCRDPTGIYTQREFDNASSLYRKSRELVLLAYQKKETELNNETPHDHIQPNE